jgi:NAD-dependent SIR2 family protein deacetylase
MTYGEFIGNPLARQRYWARSFIGWHSIADARPNEGHRALAQLDASGWLSGTVTQNVDGLHQAAGARSVIELHGSLRTVICLSCRQRRPRAELDSRLRDANPSWGAVQATLQADGDVAIDEASAADFVVVECHDCGGVLKPDVVFFGESVPKERVARCFALFDNSSALLVVGSSLTVMSGYRFVLHAAKLGVPVVIINQGETRGDSLAAIRIDAPLGHVLPALASVLVGNATTMDLGKP